MQKYEISILDFLSQYSEDIWNKNVHLVFTNKLYLHNIRYENVVKEEEDDEDDDSSPPFKSGTGPSRKQCEDWEKKTFRILFHELTEDELIKGKRYGCSLLCKLKRKTMENNKKKCMDKFKETFCTGTEPQCGSVSCGLGYQKNKCDV